MLAIRLSGRSLSLVRSSVIVCRPLSSNVPDTSSVSSASASSSSSTPMNNAIDSIVDTKSTTTASTNQYSVSSSSTYNEVKIGVTLQRFGTNLTKLSLEGKLDPVVGRDKEVCSYKSTTTTYMLILFLLRLIVSSKSWQEEQRTTLF